MRFDGRLVGRLKLSSSRANSSTGLFRLFSGLAALFNSFSYVWLHYMVATRSVIIPGWGKLLQWLVDMYIDLFDFFIIYLIQ